MGWLEDTLSYIADLGKEEQRPIQQSVVVEDKPIDWAPIIERFKAEKTAQAKEEFEAHNAALKNNIEAVLANFEITRLGKFILIKYGNDFRTLPLDDFKLSLVKGSAARIYEDSTYIIKTYDGKNFFVQDAIEFYFYYDSNFDSLKYQCMQAPKVLETVDDKLTISGVTHHLPLGTGNVIADRFEALVREYVQ